MKARHIIAIAVCAVALLLTFAWRQAASSDQQAGSDTGEQTETTVNETVDETDGSSPDTTVAPDTAELQRKAEEFALLQAPLGYQDTEEAYLARISPMATPRFIEENSRPGDNSLADQEVRDNFIVYETTLNPEIATTVEVAEDRQSAVVTIHLVRVSTGWYSFQGTCVSDSTMMVAASDGSGAQEERCVEVWPLEHQLVIRWIQTADGWRADEQLTWSDTL